MDVLEADLLKEIDPTELGQRIRAARVAKGWTQTELAGENISVGYVSRIESGQRRPNSATLEALAVRLEVPTEHLLRGVTAREYDELKLMLDFAELSLETGQHLEAESQARQAIDRAGSGSQDELVFRGTYIVARALEGQGNLDDAIIALETLVYSKRGGLVRIKAAIAMVRCLRISGDLARAIEVGERVMASLEGSHIDSCDESVQLTVTVASAHFARGDMGHAIRMCRKAITKAEALDSPIARASAYWNASIFEAERGSVSNAVPLAERALALFAEGNDSRNLARLRTALGQMQLELEPPAVDEAKRHLTQAADELTWSSASVIEISATRLSIARAHYLEGDAVTSQLVCAEVIEALGDGSPILAAQAHALDGQIRALHGDVEDAKRSYRRAVFLLTGIGADRDAAQCWFELADLLEDVGELEASRDAYRSAAASSGLRSRSKVQANAAQRV